MKVPKKPLEIMRELIERGWKLESYGGWTWESEDRKNVIHLHPRLLSMFMQGENDKVEHKNLDFLFEDIPDPQLEPAFGEYPWWFILGKFNWAAIQDDGQMVFYQGSDKPTPTNDGGWRGMSANWRFFGFAPASWDAEHRWMESLRERPQWARRKE